jgi:hypothetical protein
MGGRGKAASGAGCFKLGFIHGDDGLLPGRECVYFDPAQAVGMIFLPMPHFRQV